MRTTRLTALAGALALAAALVPTSTAAATGRAEVHLLTTDGTLVTGSSALPLLGHRVRVRGLDARDRLTGIDVQPATGDLYGIGKSGRLYRLDPRTGQATGISAPAPVEAAPVGFDFNPQRKRDAGKKHNAALICLGRRRCDGLFAMLRNKTHYRRPEPTTKLDAA